MAAKMPCHHQPSSTSSSSMAMISPRSGTRKPAFRFRTSAHGSSSSSNLSLTAVTDKKVCVFEDQLRGILCYRDENGELICEGYDEGPRLGIRLPEKACFPWPVEVQVTDFIQLARLQVFEDVDVLQLKDDQKRKLGHDN
ncbi:hypothetical protein HU200_035453 [Digitaria exilis]|uniref:Uncharacterized protein n=1 Tax=Digitaria exilis TaxID=1010633 RepID=A0A835BRM2_9POAL|nr:hypothetical protein HU200_035453 [Digitaria exilis]